MVLQKMEQLQKFKTLFSDVWNTEALGADVGTWIIVVLIFLFFVMLRGVFTRFLFTRLGKLTAKTKTDLDDHVFKAVEKPVSLLPVVIGLFIATSYLDPEGKLAGITYNLENL